MYADGECGRVVSHQAAESLHEGPLPTAECGGRDGSCAACLQRLARTSSKHPQVAEEQVALEGEERPPVEPASHLTEWPDIASPTFKQFMPEIVEMWLAEKKRKKTSKTEATALVSDMSVLQENTSTGR